MNQPRSSGRSRRRSSSAVTSTHEVRAGATLSDVLDRAGPGDVVVIDAVDLDAATARRLLDVGVFGVVNAQPSLSGRYPATGPIQLVEAGVVLIDAVGDGVVTLREGDRVLVQGGDVLRHGTAVVSGRRRTALDLRADMQVSRDDGGVEIRAQALVADTVALIRARPELIEGSAGSVELRTRLRGRVALIVAGALSADELAPIRRLNAPVVLAAGSAGAAAAHAAGLDIDVICDHGTASHRTLDEAASPIPLALPQQPLESAVLLAVGADAAAVVIAGSAVDDLTGLMDQTRSASAGSALTRLVTAGRVINAASLASLTTPGRETRRATRSRGRSGRGLVVAGGLVGVLVGAGIGAGAVAAIQGTSDELAASRTAVANLQQNNEALAQRLGDSESFARSVEGEVVAGQLEDQRLVLVVAPGASNQLVDGVDNIVEQAGGTWSGSVRLSESFVDPGRVSSWDDLALRLAPPEADFEDATGSGERAAEALAASLVATGDLVGESSDPARGFLDALVELDGATSQGGVEARASRAVLVVSESATSPMLSAVASQLAAAGGVVVVSGEAAGDGLTGEFVESGAGAQSSVVGGALRASGRVALVTALVEAAQGTFGVFGSVERSTGAEPTPSPTPLAP